jgi:hypothetical protein
MAWAPGVGAKAAGLQRERALAVYMANPNFCLQCGEMIVPKPGAKPAGARAKKFCNQSCNAKYNNRGTRRHPPRQPQFCSLCGTALEGLRGDRRMCDDCTLLGRFRISSRRTKGETKEQHVRGHARRVLALSGRAKLCTECGYSTFVDVCHIRALADFPLSALLGEINDEANLVYLCPNHHRELDAGLLKLADIA